MTKHFLPNGCWVSELTVLPRNWKSSKKTMKETWRIAYRFYDPHVKDAAGKVKPKQVQIKRMNSFGSWEERIAATEFLLQEEWDMLKRLGYNPHTRSVSVSSEITETTSLLPALNAALERMDVIPRVKKETEGYLRYMAVSIAFLGLDSMPVKEVEPKHIVAILEYTKSHALSIYEHLSSREEEKVKTKDKLRPPQAFTPAKYNRYRKNLGMLFAVLKGKLHLIKTNPVTDVQKAKQVKTLRRVLTKEEREKVKKHLYTYNRDFYRFLQIFFPSGSRETELLSVKGKDVDLERQVFKCLVRKRKEGPVEVERIITDAVLPFWQEALRDCEPEQYVFSHWLRPGEKLLDANLLNKHWRKWVKKELDIDVSLYSLKHQFTTEARAILTAKEIAEQLGHTDTSMVEKIYDLEAVLREQKKIKKVNNLL